MSKVKVTADAVGNVIVPSKNNPDWGHIRVEQTRNIVDELGFGRVKVVSALIQGEIKELKQFGWSQGKELEGKIITKESFEPFNKKEPERDYKIAGKSGIPCCVNGEPIYTKNFYREDNSAQDEFLKDSDGVRIRHTNTDEIKAAYAKLKEGVDSPNNASLQNM
jgi:hypothetical protein